MGDKLWTALESNLDSDRSVRLQLDPAPSKRPVELQLKTVEGETITMKVGLDGARQSVNVSEDAQWRVIPGNFQVSLNRKFEAQEALLQQVVAGGNTAKKDGTILLRAQDWLIRADDYETNYKDAQAIHVHLHGNGGAWFGMKKFALGATMRASRSRYGCDLLIEFIPKLEPVELAGITLAEAGQITGVTAIDPAEVAVDIGYLEQPYCGGPVR